MKKALLLLLLIVAGFSSAFAQKTTTDYMYTEGVKYDEEEGLHYFDVYMKGSDIYYTTYQADILLPTGLQVVKSEGEPYVFMLDSDFVDDYLYPKTNRKFTHTLALNFIESQSHLRLGCSTMSSTNRNFTKTSGPLFRVYVEMVDASTPWPLGAIKFFDAKFVTENAIGYAITDREDMVVVHSGETTLPFNVSSAAKWSTCILPFSATIPTGVKAYTCTSNDEKYVNLTEANSLSAYTPYILYAENGYTGTLTGTVDPDDYPKTGVVKGSYLNGAIAPQTATSGFILQNQSEGVKFYAIKEGDSFLIPAGKCWMTLPEGTNAKALGFKIEGADGIKNTVSIPASSLIFDISGRQQQNVGNGIIIKNGKKILNR